ncbi:MAG: hypothetical protein KF850_06870 [Labilithrix sp.]|nr:hypothetical protein [Labilithrix sp.]
MRLLGSSLLLATLVLACSSTSTTGDIGSQTDALEAYRDGCDAGACGARPAPQHQCVGGYAVSVCTKARGACGWQIDCADEPPPDYDGNVGVSPCDVNTTAEQACGPLPVYDDADCVYGFIGEPQCERYGNASCAWSRRCRPKPCDQSGTCNALDRSKLGAACDAQIPCPTGSSCGSISVNIGDYVPPTCIEGDPCSALTCAPGLQCYVAESYPLQVGCGR